MISKAKIINAVDDAEKDFRECWLVLKKIKTSVPSPITANELLAFQPKLAEAIFKLSKLYQELHQEKKHFIKRKQSIDKTWFNKRLRKIKDYQDAISTSIAIGKALGDAFAWFFYHKERNALVEHLKHERIFYPPPGIGGIGELEFIKRMQVLDGHLVLYHGITNLLRLGDLSFIDLKTFELAGIAELKTKQVGPEEIEVNFLLKGKGERLLIALENQASESKKLTSTDELPAFDLPSNIQQKLKGQLHQIEKSFDIIPSDKDFKISDQTNIHGLEQLFDDVNIKQTTFNRIGKAQVLTRANLRGKTLSSRLLGNIAKDWSKEFVGLEQVVVEILLKESDDNRLYIASLHNPTPKHRIIPGVIPLFWWSIRSEIIEKILFHNSLLLSTYNPARFLEGLRNLGCEVNVTEKGYEVKKKIGNGFATTVEGIPYFIELIVGQFYPEESILELIDQVFKMIEEKKIDQPTRINMRFFEMFS